MAFCALHFSQYHFSSSDRTSSLNFMLPVAIHSKLQLTLCFICGVSMQQFCGLNMLEQCFNSHSHAWMDSKKLPGDSEDHDESWWPPKGVAAPWLIEPWCILTGANVINTGHALFFSRRFWCIPCSFQKHTHCLINLCGNEGGVKYSRYCSLNLFIHQNTWNGNSWVCWFYKLLSAVDAVFACNCKKPRKWILWQMQSVETWM